MKLKRLFAYRLRTILVVVSVAACLAAVVGRDVAQVVDRANAIRHLRSIPGVKVITRKETDWRMSYRQWFVDEEDICAANTIEAFRVSLTDDDLKVAKHLPELRIVKLRGTEVTDVGVRYLAQAKNLVEVYIDNDKISDESFKVFASLPLLERLDARQRYVEGSQPRPKVNLTPACLNHLRGHQNLVRIHIGCSLDSDALAALLTLPRLSADSLSLESADDRAIGNISRFHGVRSLYLYDCECSPAALRQLSVLTSLNALHMTGPSISDAHVANLSLPQLTTLSLQGTAITDKCGDSICLLSTLEYLNLWDSHLTCEILNSICRLRRLRDLYVDEFAYDDRATCSLATMRQVKIHRRQYPPLPVVFNVSDAGLRALAKVRQFQKRRTVRASRSADASLTNHGVIDFLRSGGDAVSIQSPDVTLDCLSKLHRSYGVQPTGLTFYWEKCNRSDDPLPVEYIQQVDVRHDEACLNYRSINLRYDVFDLRVLEHFPNLRSVEILAFRAIGDWRAIERMSKLESFWTQVKMDSQGVRSLARQPQLRLLRFDVDDSVTSDDLEPIAALPKLTKLYVFALKTDDQVAAVLESSSVEELYMSVEPGVDCPSFGHVAALNKLRVLKVKSIDDAALFAIEDNSSVELLSITGNQVTDEGIEHAAERFPRVTHLAIQSNSVTDVSLSHIGKRFPQLIELRVTSNSIVGDGLAHLHNPKLNQLILYNKAASREKVLSYCKEFPNVKCEFNHQLVEMQ